MAAADKFPGSAQQSPGANNPANDAAPVVPADGADLPGGVTVGLVIGVAGNLQITTRAQADGASVTLLNVPAGILPLRVRRVWAAGTTAANISALYP